MEVCRGRIRGSPELPSLLFSTLVAMGIHLNSLEARPTNQPSTQAPDDNTKEP